MRKYRMTTAFVLLLAGTVRAESPQFKLEIGHDTTRINGPALPDGTIDYGRAMWNQMSAGLTDENNAAPLLVKAGAGWKRYEEGVHDTAKFNQIDDELIAAQCTPWTPSDRPDVAAWLAQNDAELKMVDAAVRRGRLWPPKPQPGELPSLTAFHLGTFRDFANALIARAMEREGAGDFSGARADFKTMHQLGALLADAPDMLGFLVAGAFDGMMNTAELNAVRAAPAAVARALMEQRLAIGPLQISVAAVDVGTRYDDLNRVMEILRGHAPRVFDGLTGLDTSALFDAKDRNAGPLPGDLADVDWNIVLRQINAVDDEAVQVVRQPTASQRYKAAQAYSKKLEIAHVPPSLWDIVAAPRSTPAEITPQRAGRIARQFEAFLHRRAGETTHAYSQRISQLFTRQAWSVEEPLALEARREEKAALYDTAIALEVYKKEHGEYPDLLAALVPGYLTEAPVDIYSAKDPVYRRAGGAYIVYSVGPNGKDDGGAIGTDDIVLQSPP